MGRIIGFLVGLLMTVGMTFLALVIIRRIGFARKAAGLPAPSNTDASRPIQEVV